MNSESEIVAGIDNKAPVSANRILMGTAIRVGFWLLLFAAFYFAFEEIGRNWTAVVAGAMRIPTWRVGLSVVLATIGFSLVPLSLKIVYEDLSNFQSVSITRIFGAYHVANFFRYVPGKVAVPIYLMQFSGLERALVLQSLVTTVFHSVLVGGFTIVALILSATTEAMMNPKAFLWLLPLFVFVHPKVMAGSLTLLLRIAKRDKAQSIAPVSANAWLKSFFIMLGSWIAVGFSFQVLVSSYRELGFMEAAVCVFAYPASFVVGFAVLFAPAGLGVREGMLTWLLTVPVPISADNTLVTATALMVVFLHRVIVTFADVALLAIGYLLLRPFLPSARTTSDAEAN